MWQRLAVTPRRPLLVFVLSGQDSSAAVLVQPYLPLGVLSLALVPRSDTTGGGAGQMRGVAHVLEARLCLGESSGFHQGDQGHEAGDRRLPDTAHRYTPRLPALPRRVGAAAHSLADGPHETAYPLLHQAILLAPRFRWEDHEVFDLGPRQQFVVQEASHTMLRGT